MAQRGVQLDQEKLCCSICLDLLKDPVTIPCGHSYCMNCIESCWDEEAPKQTHSCPQCRQTFTPRPALVKNTLLADLVEDLKKTGLQAAPADHCYAGPEDVACDFCTGRKLKAIRSCLQCLVSYCDQHVQPHHKSPAFENHKLVHPTKRLKENMCSYHDEVMKIFCRTDQQCICYLCSMDEHKGHNTVSAAAERTEKQRELEVRQQKIQQKIKVREEDVTLLQQEVKVINQSADKVVSSSEKIFTGLIHLIERRRSDVMQQIRSQQTSLLNRVQELQQQLEEELTELRREDAELGQLSHTEDHIHFLHYYPLLSSPSESMNPTNINIRPLSYFEDVMTSVSAVRDKLQDTLSEGWTKISMMETKEDVLLPQAEPKTRSEFLQYRCQMTLDPNTAHIQLILSNGNRRATVVRKPVLYPQHPDRFFLMQQVLGTKSLTGRHYWEVERKRTNYKAAVAVTYKDISRTEKESEFGNNDKSWALTFSHGCCKFVHNNITTSISGSGPYRIGVYLDHRAGTLSFYSVSETMTLLHRVQTTFTQPLYAGLSVYVYDKSVELCELK
uniref:Tripartite motif-containing protein 16-like n=1 Tax=Anabas testudineus TaxID=64144 RepID=A0A7N6B852_ANATE